MNKKAKSNGKEAKKKFYSRFRRFPVGVSCPESLSIGE